MSHDGPDVVSRVYQLPGRATRAVIDLDAISANVRLLRENLRSGTGLMAVVKADGYGHGAVMTARVAMESGADRLGVATVGEVAGLRSAGIAAPVLILGSIDPTEIDRALDMDAELVVGSQSLLSAVQAHAEALGRIAAVHIKVDTGMHRYGITASDTRSAIEAAITSTSLRLAGICTHLATADDPTHPAMERQLGLFTEAVDSVRALLPPNVAIHASNSAASIRGAFAEATFDRVGIAMYGLRPGPGVEPLPGMRPALSLVSRLARVHGAIAGDGVSYGHAHLVMAEERLGLVPIGYADGYPRSSSNRGWVWVSDATSPVRGRVCMDQIIVGDLPESAREGDAVGLLGPILRGPSADELAGWAGTINYEIVAGLSPRIPRYYVRRGTVVATMMEGRLDEF